MPKSLFSTSPPIELLNKACRSIGLQDSNDSKWVDETAYNTALAEEVRNDLRPYYYNCIAKTYYEREIQYRDHITIIRQILKHFNRSLKRQEKCMKMSPGVYKYFPQYQLSPAAIPESGVPVAFL